MLVTVLYVLRMASALSVINHLITPYFWVHNVHLHALKGTLKVISNVINAQPLVLHVKHMTNALLVIQAYL